MDTLARCHYDVSPYRDALHRRNNGCCLLLLALLIGALLDVISTFTSANMRVPPPKDGFDDVVFDPFVIQLLDIFRMDIERILDDIKNIYPDGLELDIHPRRRRHRIKLNRPTPVCLATPRFLVPFVSSELWLQTNVKLDNACFARIDPLPSRILERFDEDNKLAVQDRQPAICWQLAKVVMKDSFFVIDPERGMLYMLTFDATKADMTGCSYMELQLRPLQLNKLEFDAMLNTDSAEYGAYIAETNTYCKGILLTLICAAFVGRTIYTAASLLLEASAAAFIVWGITCLMTYFGVFRAMNRRWRSPTLIELFRVQLLLCVPDLSVRLVNVSVIGAFSRVCARVMIALLLLVDAYQNEPLQI